MVKRDRNNKICLDDNGFLNETINYTYQTKQDGLRSMIEINPESRCIYMVRDSNRFSGCKGRGRKLLINACLVSLKIHNPVVDRLRFDCVWVSDVYSKPIVLMDMDLLVMVEYLRGLGLILNPGSGVDYVALLSCLIDCFVDHDLCGCGVVEIPIIWNNKDNTNNDDDDNVNDETGEDTVGGSDSVAS